MMNSTEETLQLIFVSDILANYKIIPKYSYIDLRVKLQTDKEFVKLLTTYKDIMMKESNNA
jgi:hypothetical protein